MSIFSFPVAICRVPAALPFGRHLSPVFSAYGAAGRWAFTHGVGNHGLGDSFYEFGGHGQTLRSLLPTR